MMLRILLREIFYSVQLKNLLMMANDDINIKLLTLCGISVHSGNRI
jgi:hypothetical protein